MRVAIMALAVALAASAAGAAEAGNPADPLTQVGVASWYGPGFHGKLTASGDRFDQRAMTAAHRKLPLGTRVKVTNLENDRFVIVEINDRGPYIRGRVLDLSKGAARKLGMVEEGLAEVRIEILPTERQRTTVARGEDRGAAGLPSF